MITVKATITPDARISKPRRSRTEIGVTFRSRSFSAPTAVPGFLNPVIGANILAIMLGRTRRRVGFSLGMGRAPVTVGVVGLLSTAAYILMIISSGGDSAIGIIGLVERGASHPFLIGLLCEEH